MTNLSHSYRSVLQALVIAATVIAFTGCAAPGAVALSQMASGAGGAPVASRNAGIHLTEYPLVEESEDNPDHLNFLDRAAASVSRQQSGLFGTSDADVLRASNSLLTGFDFRLAANPGPPFTGFAVYRSDTLLARDIARFWPVTLSRDEENFVLPFETYSGEQMVATREGISDWPDVANTGPVASIDPAFFEGRIAYAAADTGSVAADESGIFSNSNLDLNQPAAPGDIFATHLVAGQPFYIYASEGVVHLNYAGRDLPYLYDQVVHNQAGELTVFNPGGEGNVLWFFALRDGLWYYVEVDGKQ